MNSFASGNGDVLRQEKPQKEKCNGALRNTWPPGQSTDYIRSNPSEKLKSDGSSRWAAKEAVIKACKPRRVSFSSIEVLYNNSEPYAVVLDTPAVMLPPVLEPKSEDAKRVLEGFQHLTLPLSLNLWQSSRNLQPAEFNSLKSQSDESDNLDGQAVRLSISHDGDYVVATCLASEIP